jgi:hypothetical protein
MYYIALGYVEDLLLFSMNGSTSFGKRLRYFL